MQNSSYTYARLWLRTSARALLQCHKQLLATDSGAIGNTNEEFLLQVKTYLDQLEVPELVEVIHHLTNEINQQCASAKIPEQKFLCYRGATSEYNQDLSNQVTTNTTTTELNTDATNTVTSKKKVRYYRGSPIE